MKIMQKTGVFLGLLWLSSPLFCDTLAVSKSNFDESLRHESLSVSLFPETYSWVSINKMPLLDYNVLQKIKPSLRNAYLVSKISRSLDGFCSKEFSFIECFFEDANLKRNLKNFHIADIDEDGNNDIIYAGDGGCVESGVTIIWHGSPQGYAVKQEWIKSAGVALRLKQGKPALISSVDYGCCDDPIDRYHILRLPGLKEINSRMVTKRTTMPTNSSKPISFIAAKDLILRSSPVESDQYDKDASIFNERAILGNMVVRYLPQCSGEVIGMERDKNYKTWYFVTLDSGCYFLRTYMPFDVNTGWTSSKLSLKNR